MIYPSAEENIPSEVRAGLLPVLRGAINETARHSKLCRFAFETSEDAVSWTVFRYLHEKGAIGRALQVGRSGNPSLLFWGAPYTGSDVSLGQCLVDVLKHDLLEDGLRLTEPDIVLEWADLLVFVEVKYRSANDKKRRYKHFSRYLDGNLSLFCCCTAKVEEAGFYELTRNWVAGSILAQKRKRDFVLINLAPAQCERSARQFAKLVSQQNSRRFEFLTWHRLLDNASPLDPWFLRYAQLRHLLRP